MPTTQIGDIELHYEVAGAGPPLLFISGTGGDLRQRPNVLEGPLVGHFTVAAYDQRGLGRSSKPDRPATMADYGDDAAALVDHLGWTTARVVGVSFGGMVAQHLAIRRPDLIQRLVLCCTSSGGRGGASYPLHELAGLPDEVRLRTSIGLSDTRRGDEWQQANPDKAAEAIEAVKARAAVGDAGPQARVGAQRQLEARRGHDTWERLSEIKSTTLVCAGRYDGIAPVANSEVLVERIPDARLSVFDGGHLFLLQDRAAWPAIIEFLAD